MADVWWVVAPPSEASTASTTPKDAEVLETSDSSADYNTLLDGGTITVSGKQWARFMGPFTSQSAATSAKPNAGNILSILAGGAAAGITEATGAGTTAAATAAGTADNATENVTGSIDDFMQFPAKVLGWISDRNNMVRVVKVVVGSLMILTGVNMLIKDTTKIDPMGAVTSIATKAAVM